MKLILLLLLMATLAIVVLFNLTPVPLVILGIQFPALPLGLWFVGAIVAGALTTLLISGLFNLSRPVVPAARASRTNRYGNSSFGSNTPRSPWAGRPAPDQRESVQSGAASSGQAGYRAARADDWGAPPSESWDNWGATPPQPDYRYQPQTEIRDTEDEVWANWDGYEDLERNRREDDFEEFDDLDENQQQDRSPRVSPPRRTEFESKQEPVDRRQSGSVYSYSYRKPEEDSPKPTTARPGEVYDAEYRVLTPPYRPDLEDSPLVDSPTPSQDDDEDWGLDDDEEEEDRR